LTFLISALVASVGPLETPSVSKEASSWCRHASRVRASRTGSGDLVVGDLGEPGEQVPLGAGPGGVAVKQPQLLGGDPGAADLLVVIVGVQPGRHPRP
jgi:hypothetical protein